MPKPAKKNSNSRAFTYVETLVALSIGAAVLTVVVISYSAILGGNIARQSAENVVVADRSVLYGYTDTNAIAVGFSPNFGASAMAEGLRENFLEDVSRGVAVYCLGRDGRSTDASTMRPNSLTLPVSTNARTLTPDAFLGLLSESVSGASGVFTSFPAPTSATNTSSLTNANLSVFILGATGNSTSIPINAIYETDMITTTSPPGTYASVRRFQGTTCTAYYHVFFPNETSSFAPQAEYFPRGYTSEVKRPFYYIWWPDPAAPRLAQGTNPSPPYRHSMAGRTSFFFVVPVFPPL